MNSRTDDEPVLELRELQPLKQPERASITIDVLDDRLTTESFPTVRIMVTNRSDEQFRFSWQEPREPPWMNIDVFPNQLGIYPIQYISENRVDEPGCCRVEQFGRHGDGHRGTLDPGKTLTNKYGIVFVEGKLRDWPDPGTYLAPMGTSVGERWGFEFELVQIDGDPLPREPTADNGLVLTDVHLDAQPDPLRMSVEIIEDRLTDDSVPVAEITMENTGEEPHEVYVSSSRPLPWPPQTTDAGTFHIVPPRIVHQLVMNEPGCPRMEQLMRAGPAPAKPTPIEPGEVITEKYAIVGIDGEYEGDCPEPGIYRSEARLGVEDRWGFELDFVEA